MIVEASEAGVAAADGEEAEAAVADVLVVAAEHGATVAAADFL